MNQQEEKEIEQQVSLQEKLQADKQRLLQLAQDNEEMELAYARMGWHEPVEQ